MPQILQQQLIEAGLSFLGIGVQIPTPSWGAIIDQHKGILFTLKIIFSNYSWCSYYTLVFSFMILGHHLRNVFSKKANATVWKKLVELQLIQFKSTYLALQLIYFFNYSRLPPLQFILLKIIKVGIFTLNLSANAWFLSTFI